MTISEDIAAPGFLSDIHASGYLVAKLTPAPDELGLASHGLELTTPDPNWAQVYPDGRALLIGRDIETTTESFAQFSTKDAETWCGLYQNYLAAKAAIIGMNAAPPIPELGSYRSPLANVYLCGARSHPGSGVTMAPGRNAARVIAAISDLPFRDRRQPTLCHSRAGGNPVTTDSV
jgi:phytoene dehydrogenase-like protein